MSTPEDERTHSEIIHTFDKYAIGETNETYERDIFHTRKQWESETVESFITALRTLVKTCNFCDNYVSSVLRDQVVLGIHNPQTQAELLKIRQLDLQRCIDICKLSENPTVQFRILRLAGVNRVDFKPKRKSHQHKLTECAGRVHSDMNRVKSYVLHLAKHVLNVMERTTLLWNANYQVKRRFWLSKHNNMVVIMTVVVVQTMDI